MVDLKCHINIVGSFYFLFKAGEKEKGNFKVGSFPQLILTEEKKEQKQVIGILLKIWLEATHLAS
jgi:hypothetical protein